MAGLSRAQIIGNLGRDPEMRFTPTGKAVTTFSVAVNHRYNANDGETREETYWFRVEAWGKLAETCNQFLQKGRLVYVDGRLRTREWTGQDGQKRNAVEIVAQDMRVLDRAKPATLDEPAAEGDIEADDLPF